MIRKIFLKNIACYNDEKLHKLSKINFLYGANGTGKTTISKIINNENHGDQCSVEWENNSEIKTLVYNYEFVKDNFMQTEDIKGVFTLGEESKKIRVEIKDIKKNMDRIENDIKGLDSTKEKKEIENSDNEKSFKQLCWELKKRYDGFFKEAFIGYRGNKSKFKDKIILEYNNKSELKTADELKEKSETIFDDDIEKVDKIRKIDFSGLETLENKTIYKEKIIGKEDVDIADMIKKLNNSDWLKQGLNYYKKNGGICPFCQQNTPVIFKKQLEEYFDETYNNNMTLLNQCLNDYELEIQDIINQIKKILDLDNEYLKKDILNKEQEIIQSKALNNIKNIKRKLKEPSNTIEIITILENLKQINKIISDTNEEIKKHNKLIDNIEEEKKKLKSQIWRLLAFEIEHQIKKYNKSKKNINKAIKSLKGQIQTKKEELNELSEKIESLESKIRTIKPTIIAINRILSSFGFKSFKLAEAEKKGNYKIIRENGEDAKSTLSEGEKTFISFLYFYYLIHGSLDRSAPITTDKIVVFDDPISSLDSSVLFIVSNLIKKIINEVRKGKGEIKQIFVLTHNVYFHNEVTYISSRESNNERSDTTFWIIRKIKDKSQIFNHDNNPIKTSYALLWQEIQDAKKISKITLQNTLRRIIENYFKILGGINETELLDKFEGSEKIVCQSLLSWINQGSHIINDDLLVENSIDKQEKYLDVFKKIFIETGQINHYEMMMENCDK